jgi:hypothetical protein
MEALSLARAGLFLCRNDARRGGRIMDQTPPVAPLQRS